MCTASSFSCHESLADSVDPASLLVVFEWCLKINSHWKKCPLQHMLQLLLYIMCWISTLTCLYIDVNIPNYLKNIFFWSYLKTLRKRVMEILLSNFCKQQQLFFTCLQSWLLLFPFQLPVIYILLLFIVIELCTQPSTSFPVVKCIIVNHMNT